MTSRTRRSFGTAFKLHDQLKRPATMLRNPHNRSGRSRCFEIFSKSLRVLGRAMIDFWRVEGKIAVTESVGATAAALVEPEGRAFERRLAQKVSQAAESYQSSHDSDSGVTASDLLMRRVGGALSLGCKGHLKSIRFFK